MDNQPVSLLGRAIDQAGAVIAGVRPEQADAPTPCRSWTVRQLVEHVIHDLAQFTATAEGGTPDWSAKPPPVGDDWLAAYRAGASELMGAWRRAGDLSGTRVMHGMGEVPARLPVDMQIAELALHTWDLARATGQSTGLDPGIGGHALSWLQESLKPQFRGPEADGKAFGPEVPIPEDAPIYDRLAAFSGRDPKLS